MRTAETETFVPTASVEASNSLMQKQGKPFTARLHWTPNQMSSLPITHHQAVVLRDALHAVLEEHDYTALERILKGDGETGEPLTTVEDLDRQPIGTVIADKDHDDWTKLGSGDWQTKGGPICRPKTMVTLWGPFTVVRVGS